MAVGVSGRRVLSIVVCGAGPAIEFISFVRMALDRGWDVQVIATTAALAFFDQATVEALTGNPVRSQYSPPGSPRSRIPDAIVVAPATYNTINKWAQGSADTYALGVLAEQTGLRIPIVVLPYVNAALASRAPFQQSVKTLRAEGVSILLGPGAFEPEQPRKNGSLSDYPWHLALDEVEGIVGATSEDDPED
jgi:phosphopantothenoylcysteine synthetase/decarboxylase